MHRRKNCACISQKVEIKKNKFFINMAAKKKAKKVAKKSKAKKGKRK